MLADVITFPLRFSKEYKTTQSLPLREFCDALKTTLMILYHRTQKKEDT